MTFVFHVRVQHASQIGGEPKERALNNIMRVRRRENEYARSEAIDYTYTFYASPTLNNADFHLFVHLINANALHFILWFTVL